MANNRTAKCVMQKLGNARVTMKIQLCSLWLLMPPLRKEMPETKQRNICNAREELSYQNISEHVIKPL